jgi:hypothetical protein
MSREELRAQLFEQILELRFTMAPAVDNTHRRDAAGDAAHGLPLGNARRSPGPDDRSRLPEPT